MHGYVKVVSEWWKGDVSEASKNFFSWPPHVSTASYRPEMDGSLCRSISGSYYCWSKTCWCVLPFLCRQSPTFKLRKTVQVQSYLCYLPVTTDWQILDYPLPPTVWWACWTLQSHADRHACDHCKGVPLWVKKALAEGMLCIQYQCACNSTDPFFLMFWRRAQLPLDLVFKTDVSPQMTTPEYAVELKRNLEAAYEKVWQTTVPNRKCKSNSTTDKCMGICTRLETTIFQVSQSAQTLDYTRLHYIIYTVKVAKYHGNLM